MIAVLRLGARIRIRLAELAIHLAGSRHLLLALRHRAALFAIAAPVGRVPLRSSLSSQDLVGLAAERHSRRLLLVRRGASPTETINLLDREELVPLGRTVLSSPDWDPAEQSLALYQSIVLNQVTISRPALRACLLSVSSVAQRLERTHQHSIFKRCLTIITTPIDPYQSASLVFAAREAAVALIISDSSLQQQVVDEIGQSKTIDPLRDVIGAAIRSGDLDNPAGFLASVLETHSLDEKQAITLGELCNTGFSAGDPVLSTSMQPWPLRRHTRLTWAASHLLPVLLGPLIGFSVFALSKLHFLHLPSGLIISAGAALGALALLIAAHVVSAQLAAERLPGSLARFSSQPRGVIAGYSCGFSLVAVALVAARAPNNPLWLQIATVELFTFAIALIATLIALVRRTDSTEAAVGFAADQALRFQSAGERMGVIQKKSVAAQEQLESLPWARFGGSDPLNERNEPLRAKTHGFTELNLERLRALDSRPPWHSRDLILHVGGGIGTLVHRDQQIAAVIPARKVAFSPAEHRHADRAFSVSSERSIEESAESLAALTRLAGDLAAEGNPGGANRVTDALIGLLADHLGACHRSRGETAEAELDQIFPVNLALRSVLLGAVRGIGEAESATERTTFSVIVARALALSKAGDGAVTIAVNALPGPQRAPLNSDERNVLWEAGAHAIRLEVNTASGFVDSDLARRIDAQAETADPLIEIAARLTMLNIWVDQHSADKRWAWFSNTTAKAASSEARRLGVIRIGAVALLAGCWSVAIRVALAMRGENIASLRTHLKNRSVSAWESFLSDQYGHLLGSDPEQAMVDFLDFSDRLQAAVPIVAQT